MCNLPHWFFYFSIIIQYLCISILIYYFFSINLSLFLFLYFKSICIYSVQASVIIEVGWKHIIVGCLKLHAIFSHSLKTWKSEIMAPECQKMSVLFLSYGHSFFFLALSSQGREKARLELSFLVSSKKITKSFGCPRPMISSKSNYIQRYPQIISLILGLQHANLG